MAVRLCDDVKVSCDDLLAGIEHFISRFGKDNCFIFLPNPFGCLLTKMLVDTDAFTDGLAIDKPKFDKFRADNHRDFLFTLEAIQKDGRVTINIR